MWSVFWRRLSTSFAPSTCSIHSYPISSCASWGLPLGIDDLFEPACGANACPCRSFRPLLDLAEDLCESLGRHGEVGGFRGAIQIASDSMPKLILFIFDDLCCMLHTCLVKSIVCKADSCRIQFDTEGTQSSAADLSYEGDISKWSYLSRVTDFDILWTCIRAYILRAPARIYIYI